MLGRRYDGRHGVPRVELWSLWNEPNQGALLQPQWEDGRPLQPAAVPAPGARAGIAGLQRSGHGDDRILLGETAPLGVDRRGLKTNMRPGLFLRELLCLDDARCSPLGGRPAAATSRAAARLRVSGYAHHPYSIVYAPDVGSTIRRRHHVRRQLPPRRAARRRRRRAAASRATCRCGGPSTAGRPTRPTRSAA